VAPSSGLRKVTEARGHPPLVDIGLRSVRVGEAGGRLFRRWIIFNLAGTVQSNRVETLNLDGTFR